MESVPRDGTIYGSWVRVEVVGELAQLYVRSGLVAALGCVTSQSFRLSRWLSPHDPWGETETRQRPATTIQDPLCPDGDSVGAPIWAILLPTPPFVSAADLTATTQPHRATLLVEEVSLG